MRPFTPALLASFCLTSSVLSTPTALFAQDAPAAATERRPAAFPGVAIDVANKRVRIDCETLDISAPLEFFCVVSGTNEHESLLRSPIKPSHLHAGLLALGLEPGEPVKYSEAAKKWIPPHGPPLQLFIEFEKDGKAQRLPAYRLMRDVKTKKEMPPMTWIFAGSRILEDGGYAADATGYLVSVVNFDLTVIDIPQLASNANETLEWEINKDLLPAAGTKAILSIEATGSGHVAKAPATTGAVSPLTGGDAKVASAATAPTGALSDVTVDQEAIDKLQARWEAAVRPHDTALREAAQAHYDVINAMRTEQQRLIDEADRIQRKIDSLEKSYQDMTTPRPPAVAP
jgi:hypothetical protein